jgi:glycosyltransferase involved in cell wall biosynthesis
MRILVVSAFFSPLTTGSAHFSLDVARQYKKSGHEVFVVSARPDASEERQSIDDVPVTRLRTRWVNPGFVAFHYSLPFVTQPNIWGRISRILDEFRPDVIHMNGQFFDLSIWFALVARRRRIPIVMTIHTPLTHPNRLIRWVISAVDRIFFRPIHIATASQLVAVDRFTMEMYQRRYGSKSRVVRFIPATLVSGDFSGGDGKRIREELGLGDRPVVLSLGHVIPIRSRLPLVRALPELISKVPDVAVVVVGEVYDKRFLDLASQLGVRGHVYTTGRVKRELVPDFLAAADVECHDLDGHGLGITTLEAMAAGVPIVACVGRDIFPNINLDRWPLIRITEDLSPSELAEELYAALTSSSVCLGPLLQQQKDLLQEVFDSEVVSAHYLDLLSDAIQN